ncbi:unnamed protein product [Vitrella brassicaformis CCMP3155]|uniref:RRM domain-containing protein n=2 Tax=Vitrella brassicaformis TaxID=1169539 RepID=A0A0G4EDP4_VITBC|nr:unnamed protein product [Vitrella brassicaformis CCMP3155]|eukprot:CEL93650.1 unnamed protein product [Vitrella brassicaformis CCMP3155]
MDSLSLNCHAALPSESYDQGADSDSDAEYVTINLSEQIRSALIRDFRHEEYLERYLEWKTREQLIEIKSTVAVQFVETGEAYSNSALSLKMDRDAMREHVIEHFRRNFGNVAECKIVTTADGKACHAFVKFEREEDFKHAVEWEGDLQILSYSGMPTDVYNPVPFREDGDEELFTEEEMELLFNHDEPRTIRIRVRRTSKLQCALIVDGSNVIQSYMSQFGCHSVMPYVTFERLIDRVGDHFEAHTGKRIEVLADHSVFIDTEPAVLYEAFMKKRALDAESGNGDRQQSQPAIEAPLQTASQGPPTEELADQAVAADRPENQQAGEEGSEQGHGEGQEGGVEEDVAEPARQESPEARALREKEEKERLHELLARPEGSCVGDMAQGGLLKKYCFRVKTVKMKPLRAFCHMCDEYRPQMRKNGLPFLQQRGADCAIGIAMTDAAASDQVDAVILFSGDGDFVEALESSDSQESRKSKLKYVAAFRKSLHREMQTYAHNVWPSLFSSCSRSYRSGSTSGIPRSRKTGDTAKTLWTEQKSNT